MYAQEISASRFVELCLGMVVSKKLLYFTHTHIIQGVPLPTKPGISLIILKPMKILQQDLNRSTFVAWEIWWHHNMCWKWPPFPSRQDWTQRAIFWKVLASTSAVTAWISLVKFAFKASMVRGLFGKLSLSDIPIRNNEAALDRASAVAKVPSKWCGCRKRTEFRPCWRVNCGMSL